MKLIVVRFNNMNFIDLKRLFRSFGFAISGIGLIFKEENVFKAMLLVAVLVVFAMFYFELPLTQKAVLFTMIFLVMILELINSVIEKVLDFVCAELNGKIKVIKDVLAGIVLLASLGAAAIGILIFLPYFT